MHQSWVIVSEHDVRAWPNSGVAPVPGRRGVFSYRFIPFGLIAQAKAKFVEWHGAGGTQRHPGSRARSSYSRFAVHQPSRPISMELTEIPCWNCTWVTCSGKDGGLQFFPLRDHVP